MLREKAARGSLLMYAVVFGALGFSLIVVGAATYSFGEFRAAVYRQNHETALHIAEAGINYYRWHLAHDPNDFQDGTGQPGPYEHAYANASGEVIGKFSLDITPPSATSSIIVIESTGWLDKQEGSQRTIRVTLGSNALTNFALISNTDVWISNEAEINGPLHSNSGIRFDGVAEAPITSAVETYVCKPLHGNGCENDVKPGIWGQGGPETYWDFPVPSQDFAGSLSSLAGLKTVAQAEGLYLSSSGEQGWRLQFNSDGTVTAYKVTATRCYKGDELDGPQNSWFCVDIRTQASGTTYAMPASGIVFVDDTTWVDGIVTGNVTVGVGSEKSAIINSDITYLDGENEACSYKFGLIAEEDVIIPHDSSEVLTINGAFLAVNGSANRYYYSGDHKDSLDVFGSVVSNGTVTWSWVSSGGAVVSGYEDVEYTYDTCLLNNPPIGFPSGTTFEFVSWEEIR